MPIPMDIVKGRSGHIFASNRGEMNSYNITNMKRESSRMGGKTLT